MNTQVEANNLEMIRKTVLDCKIKHIYLQFTDLTGHSLAKVVSADEFLSNEHVSWYDGISIDGSLIPDYFNLPEADWLVIVPDPSTFCILPWMHDLQQRSARVICIIKDFNLDPRSCLIHVVNDARDAGFEPIFGPELIFEIQNNNYDSKGNNNRDYCKALPNDHFVAFRNVVVNNLLEMGVKVEYYMPFGAVQERIDLVPNNALMSADNIFTMKWILESLSLQFNNSIVFPKSVNKYQSSMPVHMSLWKGDEKRNVFFDSTDPLEISLLGRRFIAGILNHSASLSVLTDPYIKGDFSAKLNNYVPISGWSTERGSEIINIPMYFREKLKHDRIGWSKRCVYKRANGVANPYIAFAALLACGLDGIRQELPLSSESLNALTTNKAEPVIENEEAIKLLDKDSTLRKSLGDQLIDRIVLLEHNKITT